METLGARIKHYREKLNLSQAELGRLCGWKGGQGRIGNYERDSREPTLDAIDKIAAALQIPASTLLASEQPSTDSLTLQCAVIPPYFENGPSVFISRDELAAMALVERNLRVTVISDAGMAPLLQQGARAILDTSQQEIAPQGIYALHHEGRLMIRQFLRTVTGRWILHCENPNKGIYFDEPLEPADIQALPVAGRIVWASTALVPS
ncbi:XRE family transcriptional regulator [Pseudomonas nitroreducens]|uniref:XRE family transcriptional regulator n=1 Tax=Pseudomonas nitroreducens TaxID=46680 RepID=UPI000369A49A|nr:XRE family transcriptional regulator [Pseudomonas nitroreducens]